MKQVMFERMVNNAPVGATHYKRFRNFVIFFTNIDDKYGSFDKMYWYADEDSEEEVWFTVRGRLDMDKVVKL